MLEKACLLFWESRRLGSRVMAGWQAGASFILDGMHFSSFPFPEYIAGNSSERGFIGGTTSFVHFELGGCRRGVCWNVLVHNTSLFLSSW